MQTLIRVTMVALTLAVAGCSKQESETPVPPAKSKSTVKRPVHSNPSLPDLPPEPGTGTPSPRPTTTSGAKPPKPPTPPLPNTATELEKTYVEATDFETRIKVIYKLTAMNNATSVTALSQLFLAETDVELKVEIVDSLATVDGFPTKKLEIFKAAVSSDQHSDVRQTAIEGLIMLKDLQALPVLESLLTDKDREIRDAASAAIIEVQNLANAPVTR